MTVNELKELAEFYVVDVEAKNEGKPTKKELLTALTESDQKIGDEDVENFLKAKKEEAPKADSEPKKEEEAAEPVDTSNYVLVKYERKNPTFETIGYVFTTRHPFASVPPEVAEHLVRNMEGFRLALPSEAADYYA